MIRVTRPAEPDGFDKSCRQPGKAWLMENPTADPHCHPLWTRWLTDLRAAFETRCSFLAMRIPKGTVDHWISLKTDRNQAYEWDNYRFVDGIINSAKKPSWEGKLLDPYEIGEDWFEIQLPSLQMKIAHIDDPAVRERAEFTLEKLHLRDGEDVVRLRREWMEMYEMGEITLDGLHRVAPLLARAIQRHQSVSPAPKR
jgi:hypothetical protein